MDALPPTAEVIPLVRPAIDASHWLVSNGWTNGDHQSCEWRKEAVELVGDTVRLVLAAGRGATQRPIACAEVQSIARTYGYGSYQVVMKTAAGAGLNSNFFTYTGPGIDKASKHNEIDFEFLGKNPRTVQLNWHYNGDSRHENIIDLGFDASQGFHEYRFDWMPDKIRWFVDGKQVAETPAGANLPRDPGKLYFSLWSGSEKVDGWLGHFAYQRPLAAEVQSVRYRPLSP